MASALKKGGRIDDVELVISAIRRGERLFHGDRVLTPGKLMTWSLHQIITATAFGFFHWAEADSQEDGE